MKLFFSVLILTFGLAFSIFAQSDRLSIIPKPKSEVRIDGSFTFNRNTKIYTTSAGGKRTAVFFNEIIQKQYGFELKFAKKLPNQNAIIFKDPQPNESKFNKAGSYNLRIDYKGILIEGAEIGQFYAIQTLRQILPLKIKGSAKLSGVEIFDEPNFVYRGLHLDVSRHFMPLEFVKKYIDLMSQYKLNYFHWHLTDDQGWRIEIKKYPKLTEIASKRKESHTGRYSPVFKGDGIPVEGFYSQEQIKEVVEFAKKRQVTIIPEIELPGHSSAALAAYPEFGCKENYEYKVQQTWGIFKEVFCPTDKTFKFLEDVLDETIALFPNSPYIHIGGDEVLKDHWKESSFVQDLKKRENLKDEHEVQSYFVRRIERFLNSKGKIMIGWDEILEGGLAPNAVVMSWRGEKGGIEAAKAKHNVIMTPGNSLYLDYGQGDPMYEPLNIGNQLSIEMVYNYNPIPKELTQTESKYILGAQANVWTEYMQNSDQVEYMVFPRVLALSEVVWSTPEKKDFAEFSTRLFASYSSLDNQKVNYRIPPPIGLTNQIISNSDKATIDLNPPMPNSRIYYTMDGSEPNVKSKLYDKPFDVAITPNQRIELKTVVVAQNKRKSVPYAATIWRREMLQGTELSDRKSGVIFKFYRDNFDSFGELAAKNPTETSESKSIQLPQFQTRTGNFKDSFGVVFEGYIYIPADELYAFEIETSGKTFFEIDGEQITSENALLNNSTQTATAPLAKGYHFVRFGFLHQSGIPILNLRWGVKGTGLRRIYGSELFTKK